ncbi:unnamed protein product [Arctogadus glacialis]
MPETTGPASPGVGRLKTSEVAVPSRVVLDAQPSERYQGSCTTCYNAVWRGIVKISELRSVRGNHGDCAVDVRMTQEGQHVGGCSMERADKPACNCAFQRYYARLRRLFQ